MSPADSGHARIVHVSLNSRSYDILIRRQGISRTGQALAEWLKRPDLHGVRCLVVTDAAIASSHGSEVVRGLRSEGAETHLAVVPSGESSKCVEQMMQLYDALVEMAADRKTIVIATGGGVIGDLAGFAAATYARGLRLVQVPTTLLSMVDSSVGGKTGINHPRGKNLIGAFHQPVGVLIDLDTLSTLPDREYRSGLAEVVKYGVILDAAFFEYLEGHVAGLNERDSEVLQQVVARSCELKADVVGRDELETTGLRAILNYGHTFGHAFETLAGYGTLLHGEAIAIGMMCASRLAVSLRRITQADMQRQSALLQALQLPVRVPGELLRRPDEILRAMMLDKKTEGGALRFILPSRIGHVETVEGVSSEQALQSLIARP